MKIIIFIAMCLLLTRCSDSPEELKKSDEMRGECSKRCEPRKFKSWDSWTGCHCVVEEETK